MSPPPKIQKGKKLLPYDWKMNILTLKHSLKRSAQLKFKTLAGDLKTPGYRLSLISRQYLYPTNGAIDVKNALVKVIAENGIPIINARLSRLEIDKTVSGELSNGTTIRANHIALTSLTNVDEVHFNQQLQKIDVEQIQYIHFHLKVNDSNPIDFSYIRVMDNVLIHRVSDMSKQAPESLSKDQKIICVGIHEKEFYKHSADDLAALLLEQLKLTNLVSGSATLELQNHNVFKAAYSNKEAIRKIEKEADGQLKFLHSTNLIYGVHNELERWKGLLDTSSK